MKNSPMAESDALYVKENVRFLLALRDFAKLE